MSLAVSSSGTQTATITTEHDLATPTASGVYQLSVDLNALADGEVVELRVKKKVLTGGTIRVAYQSSWTGVLPADDLIAESPPITAPFGCTVTLLQKNGTGRAFPWSLHTL